MTTIQFPTAEPEAVQCDPIPDALYTVKTAIKDWEGTGHPAVIHWECRTHHELGYRYPPAFYQEAADHTDDYTYQAGHVFYVDCLFTLEQAEALRAEYGVQAPDQEVMITRVELPVSDDPLGASIMPHYQIDYQGITAYGFLELSQEAEKTIRTSYYAEALAEVFQKNLELGARPGMTEDELKAVFMPTAEVMVQEDLDERRERATPEDHIPF